MLHSLCFKRGRLSYPSKVYRHTYVNFSFAGLDGNPLAVFRHVLFGVGDLLVNKSYTIIQFYVDNKGDDVFWRYLAAFGLAFLALSTVAALSFMLSVFAENSIGPIVTTMSIIIVFTIISTMDLPLFTKINPFLFTSYMTSWKGFFNMATDPETGAAIRGSVYSVKALVQAAIFMLAHIAGFFGITWLSFRKKDILS